MSGEPALKRRSKRPAAASSESDGESDERAMVEAAQRDPSRFADLYEHNFERVYAFVARRVGDRDQAQDLTADVFHNALRSLGSFEWRGAPFAAWLFRIAANAIADRGKRAAKFEQVRLRAFADHQPERSELEDAGYRARLFRLVERLPADQRRIITMRFADQKRIAEIAKEIGRSEGAVKQLQFRGLQALRAMVTEK